MSGADQEAQTKPEQQDGAEPGQEDHGASPAKSQPPQHPQTYRQIAATHIDTLSRLNETLPKLLAYFAATISQLTNNPVETNQSKGKSDTVNTRQAAMWTNAMYVGLTIRNLREVLTEQINDLERYGVIPAKHPKYTALPGPGQATVAHDPEASVKNGGYGDFDVGVLNARAASGHVSSEDMLDRLQSMVEELAKRGGIEGDGEEMVVDG
ncbi:hypothetical protein EK21DRAFT_98291 [Setomelanomma holmii]|uniref:Mediator of RNA polymerase II transcription subunit 11 n=1 Tax=Setomelanomma holmii TaxID=210430 RepID=A0A9P4HET3_9PLEO|nr:hypothetical protein EK21DRAFT_98291 [Setomelanomma holmii]